MARRAVLVADDEELPRDVLSTVLDLADFEVVLAGDGDQALAELRESRPDAVVLDRGMRGRSGREVWSELRDDEELADLPVVLLTATHAGALPADPTGSGAYARLEKPFSPVHLVEVLEALLGSRP